MKGAAISITNGTASAAPTTRLVSTGLNVTCGDDSSSTGNSVNAGIDHSELITLPLASAPITGSSNGAQNAAAASRRSLSAGQIMSPIPRGSAAPPQTQ